MRKNETSPLSYGQIQEKNPKNHQVKFSQSFNKNIFVFYVENCLGCFPFSRTKSSAHSMVSSLCWHTERGPTGQIMATSNAVWNEFHVIKKNWVPATAAVAIMTSHFSSLNPSVQWDWRSRSPCKYALEKQNKITVNMWFQRTQKFECWMCREKGIQWQLKETKERDKKKSAWRAGGIFAECIKSRDLCTTTEAPAGNHSLTQHL